MADLVFLVDENSNGHHGTVCIRDQFNLSTEPRYTVHYWPLHHGLLFDRDVFFSYPELENGGTAEVDGSFGTYGFYHFTRPSGIRVELRLVDAGSTKSIKIEEHAIPPPKVRRGTEVRWHNGGWEKYTKSKGWVYA